MNKNEKISVLTNFCISLNILFENMFFINGGTGLLNLRWVVKKTNVRSNFSCLKIIACGHNLNP